MRKSIYCLIAVMLCVGCQKKTTDNAPQTDMEVRACGDIMLSPQDAAQWECVNGMYRCSHEEGCFKDGRLYQQNTVLAPSEETEKNVDINTDMLQSGFIPLEPNAKYPIVPAIKPLPYSNDDPDKDEIELEEKSVKDELNSETDASDSDNSTNEADDSNDEADDSNDEADDSNDDSEYGAKPGEGFELEPCSYIDGDGVGFPKNKLWICTNIEGCKTDDGTYYTFGEDYNPLNINCSIYIRRNSKYSDSIDAQNYTKCFDWPDELYDISTRHFEIPNQFICNEHQQLVCQKDKCCCGRGECSKGEICTGSGKCRVPVPGEDDDYDDYDNKHTHDPKPVKCGVYAKEKPPQKGVYRPDFRKMCYKASGCKCGDTICPKSTECHDGICRCAGVPSPGKAYECKHNKWVCTDPENCSPEELYKEEYCGGKHRIGEGYVCRVIDDPDIPRPKHNNPYVSDDDPMYDQFEWQCGLSGGCTCGKTQCHRGESCIDGACYCGRKEAMQSSGWICDNGKVYCSQKEGCDCFDHTWKKGGSCYLEKMIFGDESKYKTEPHQCGDQMCPAGTQCMDGQCIFFSTPYKLAKPEEYISNWGFPQCNMTEGCTCGDIQCRYGEFCYRNRCMKTPASAEINGHTIDYVPVAIKELKGWFNEGRRKDIVFIPQEYYADPEIWSIGYKHRRLLPYKYEQEPSNYYEGGYDIENHSGIDFIKQYVFNKPEKDTCRDVPYPEKSSGFVCLVGVTESSYEYGNTVYARYLPNEIGWICSQKEGCTCGENKCSYRQTCIDQKCDDFTWIKSVKYGHKIDDETKKKDDEHAAWMCNQRDGCACGDNKCDYEQICIDQKCESCIGITLRNIELKDDEGITYYDYDSVWLCDSELCNKPEGCPCGKTQCYLGGKCFYNEYCHYNGNTDYKYNYKYKGCPGKDTEINLNGTCNNGKYIYSPYLYENDPELGLKCLQEKCTCGDIQCSKGQDCTWPGTCVN